MHPITDFLMLNAVTSQPTTTMTAPLREPIGRFAPSPTGELHLGSLTTAIASYCHIKSLGGKWRLRIEDTDMARCSDEFTEQILMDLEALGLGWDGDVLYQSERTDLYNDYLQDQLAALTYGCDCSRKTLNTYAEQHGIETSPYPRLCLPRHLEGHQYKVRLQLADHLIGFRDGVQGPQWHNPQQLEGDVVVRRQDGTINYILAASIDDGLQNISHIMRGLDILPMTTAQISIMRAAGLPTVDHWYHLPLVRNASGQKLSKQNLALPIDTAYPSELLQLALKLLLQPQVDFDTPDRMLAQAIAQWDMAPLQGQHTLGTA
jgi:glutamyl-Q tRNA(Asp) synthetase